MLGDLESLRKTSLRSEDERQPRRVLGGGADAQSARSDRSERSGHDERRTPVSERAQRFHDDPDRPRRHQDDYDRPRRTQSTRSGDSSRENAAELEHMQSQWDRMALDDKRRRDEMAEQARKQEMKMIVENRQKKGTNDTLLAKASSEFVLLTPQQPDYNVYCLMQILVPEYVKALMKTLLNDKSVSPLPEDFRSPEGFAQWRSLTRARPFQDILAKMLKYKFLTSDDGSSQRAATSSKIFFKIVSARELVAKEGRPRDVFCRIEHGDLQRIKKEKRGKVFETETIKGTLSPVWNQHMKLEVTGPNDQIRVEVCDRLKQHFLGQVVLSFSDIIADCSRKRYSRAWYPLRPKDSGGSARYVGGDILIEAELEKDPSQRQKSGGLDRILSDMASCAVDNRALFRTLLRACMVLDLYIPPDGRSNLLSDESVSMLKLWSNLLTVSPCSQLIIYVDVLFQHYIDNKIPISELLNTFNILYGKIRQSGWLRSEDGPILLHLLEEMREHGVTQVTKYKEIFPKNQPAGELEATILILRMVHRFPTFRRAHSDLPESFREVLRGLLTENCISRFQRAKEMTAPFDEGNIESVVDGITKLAEIVTEEITSDFKELDVARLTTEIQLKYFILTLEDITEILSSEQAVNEASHGMFDLYKKVKHLNNNFAKLVPQLQASSTGARFDVEGWFSPFIYKWLNQLIAKTVKIVDNAVKQDSFNPPVVDEFADLPHSESITHVFSVLYQELEFITDLEWSDVVQTAQFFQMFAKTVHAAIDQYCTKIAEKVGVSFLAQAQSLLSSKNAPENIELEACVKLRNIAYSMGRLKEMYKMMNGAAISKIVKDNATDPSKGDPDSMFGAFKVFVSHAENIKPINKNGLSNPYLLLKVPEGTIPIPETILPDKNKKTDSEEVKPPVPLTGSACDVLKYFFVIRTRSITDNVNPRWEETHQVVIPPVGELIVAVLSKNLLTSDEPAGHASIDLGPGSRLRRRLKDNQTHDVFVELEPQGRVLLRITKEGEREDVDFWFRKTNERLIRVRDDLLRSLVDKIIPFTKETITKLVKENEATIVPSKSFLASLTTAATYSDVTASGANINESVPHKECEQIFSPLLDYLDNNLQTLCSALSAQMAKQVITRSWNETVLVVEGIMLPPLYGTIDPSRRLLNKRQASLVRSFLDIMAEFFHADGEELGLEMKVIESAEFNGIHDALSAYFEPMNRLMREYELAFLEGKDKEWLLRLLRIRIEKDGNDEKQKEWFQRSLTKRR